MLPTQFSPVQIDLALPAYEPRKQVMFEMANEEQDLSERKTFPSDWAGVVNISYITAKRLEQQIMDEWPQNADGILQKLQTNRIYPLSHPENYMSLLEFIRSKKNEVCHRKTLRLCFYIIVEDPFATSHHSYEFLKFVLTELYIHPVDRVLVFYMMQSAIQPPSRNPEDKKDVYKIRVFNVASNIFDQFCSVLLGYETRETLANTELVVMYLVFAWFGRFTVPRSKKNVLDLAKTQGGIDNQIDAVCALIQHKIEEQLYGAKAEALVEMIYDERLRLYPR